MSPRLPEEYADFRKQQIVEAAWECFTEKGYRETTIRDIAKKMSASTGVVYNYFEGKDQILEAVQDCGRENTTKLLDTVAQKNTVKEAIAELFDVAFELMPVEDRQKNARGAVGLWAEALKRESYRKIYASQNEYTLGKITEIIKRGINNGEFQFDIDPEAFAGFCMALVTGLQVQSVLADGLNTPGYYKQIKKILSRNIWRDADRVSDR
ncbi:MAG: TetR family transcriptional regulator [Candidatus Latescibacteria bacterium]|nr:TetR family transcriptional regulator [Candidatus Latescibacterota bacterium]NIO55196.1 TetR family transcriptional regulator [Candidatus Latescibacterota bacterium]